MKSLTEAYINSLAPNANAIKNGWGLVKKGKFQKLAQTSDETLLFGECAGSGKTPYYTSADFMNEESPVFRCTCPSRQFPCKHSLGLLYSFLEKGPFPEEEAPQDVIEKRAKIEKRNETKKEKATTPRKINKSALKKKLEAQQKGLDILDVLIQRITRSGIAAVDAKLLKEIEQTAKELGNYYLKELQQTLREFTYIWKEKVDEQTLYNEAFSQLTSLYTVCKKGKKHLSERLQREDLHPDTTTSIEEKLGHAWQLSELRECSRTERDAELLQLSFSCRLQTARKEYIDEGIWVSLNEKQLYYTKNYRPVRAAKMMKAEDSISAVLQTNELVIYPGEGNLRVRFDDYQLREVKKDDWNKLELMAETDFAMVIKKVKQQLKDPLHNKHPLSLLHYKQMGVVNGTWNIEDENGQRITLSHGEHASLNTLSLLQSTLRENGMMLVQFQHDLATGKLTAQPLSLIRNEKLIRLAI
ncbi:SWIM zinc finger family protein [Priestia koreensis]|uniref:SWIM zinc finger family protein n=1 Tax=Priestia koreensis TaxID=284581 RepID=UPI00203E0BB7|nr:SWIM zinc finger family protein [Priestia koreensis]MCM3005463.1 SWIM zinc finger family protein [Priestia koreensis]